MRYAQLVLGPAGSGKSTYCTHLQLHGIDTNRNIQVFNLDPAAEFIQYTPAADIRDLIHVEDVLEAEDLVFGPNGGLVFCMEYLLGSDGLEWFKEQIGEYDEDYILFDCPGQIELYTHMDLFQRLSKCLKSMDFNVCAVFLLDSQYLVDGEKFISGSLATLSTMVTLELPQVNVLSKMDLLNKEARKNLEKYLDPDAHELHAVEHKHSAFNKRYQKLTRAFSTVLEEYSLVRFIPLNINSEESLNDVLFQIDLSIQYGEDNDVKTVDFEYPDNEDDAND